MTSVINHGGLTIATELYNLVNDEILADSNISPKHFWSGFDKAVHELAPKNIALLKKRTKLQKKKLMNG
jgi:malate synthase